VDDNITRIVQDIKLEGARTDGRLHLTIGGSMKKRRDACIAARSLGAHMFARATSCARVLVVAAVAVMLAASPGLTEPPLTPSELRKQIDALEAQIQQRQSQLADVQQRIDEMSKELEIQVEQYKQALDQVQRARERQEEVRLRAGQVQDQLEAQQEVFARRVRALYTQGDYGYLEIILDSTSFTDLISRIYFVMLLTRQDSQMVDRIQERKKQLEEIQNELARIVEEEQLALYQANLKKLAIESELQKLTEFKKSLSADMRSLLEQQEVLLQKQRELYSRNIGEIVQAFNLPVEPGSVVETALQYLGVPYVWGGEDPETGFDCSGLVRYVYLQHGISLPHYSGYQFKMGKPVSPSELQPGDLVFFGNPVHHVGMYVGNGYFIHAPQTGDFVKLTLLSSRTDFAGARRILGYVEPTPSTPTN